MRLPELARSNSAFNEHVLQSVFRLAQRLLSLPFEGLLDLLPLDAVSNPFQSKRVVWDPLGKPGKNQTSPKLND